MIHRSTRTFSSWVRVVYYMLSAVNTLISKWLTREHMQFEVIPDFGVCLSPLFACLVSPRFETCIASSPLCPHELSCLVSSSSYSVYDVAQHPIFFSALLPPGHTLLCLNSIQTRCRFKAFSLWNYSKNRLSPIQRVGKKINSYLLSRWYIVPLCFKSLSLWLFKCPCRVQSKESTRTKCPVLYVFQSWLWCSYFLADIASRVVNGHFQRHY